MKMLSLFSGIGGIDLAAQWAGIDTVAFCERDKFCQKILAKHWPNVPCFDDVKTLTKEALENAGIRGIDIVAGGFPCQPFSIAGKRGGEQDSRHLWPAMLNIIRNVKPSWVIGENVHNFLHMGVERTIQDLEASGYYCAVFAISAYGVGALHSRRRIFIVGNSENDRSKHAVDDTSKSIFGEIQNEKISVARGLACDKGRFYEEIRASEFVRTANGIPDRMDRIKALGNAVVPQQIYPIFKVIAEIEKMEATK